MRSVRLLLLLPALLVPVACSGGESEDTEPSDAELEARLVEAQKRLETSGRHPWIAQVASIRSPITSLRSRVQNHLFHASTSDETTRVKDATQLLEQFAGIEPLIVFLERISPAANRVWQAEHDIQNMLTRMDIPTDAPFPFRSRFQNGWLRDRGTHFGYIFTGLQAVMAGRADDKLVVGVGNLDRLAAEGEQLREELNRISRRVDIMQAKVIGLGQTAGWGRRVVKLAKEKGGIDAATLKAITDAADKAEKAIPGIENKWAGLKLAFVAAPDDQRQAVIDLMAVADAHLLAVSKAGHQTALKIGMVGPHR